MSTDAPKLSPVETIKEGSDYLKGTIDQEIAGSVNHFDKSNIQLLKFHGTYQQDDRDVRQERKRQGLGKKYEMMVRTKFPGGRLTPDQYLVCDDLATKYGQGDIRATSRQTFQFHGVVRGNLRPLIHDLNLLAHVTTFGGAGDVVRNTMANPVADIDPAYSKCGTDLLVLARNISAATLPGTTAYYDLWLDDEKAEVREDGTIVYAKDLRQPVDEPLYGRFYLPRKFKIGIATDFDNAADAYAQDVGIIAATKDGAVVGYEVLVGGGLGFSHTQKETYPRTGTPFAFAQEREILRLLQAIVEVQRDNGDRTDRRLGRLKYTIDRMGLEGFREEVFKYAGHTFAPPRNIQPTAQLDYLGWHKQIQDGLSYVGVWVENGRIKDLPGSYGFKTGLRAIVEQFKPDLRVTAHCNVILANIRDEDVDAVQALLDEYRIPTDKNVARIRRMELACPALPSCPQAQSEAERIMPVIMEGLEASGHGDAGLSIRMTGCPNGCARSACSEIGLIGRGPGRCALYTGGDYNGTRLNSLLIPEIEISKLVPMVSRLLDLWESHRKAGERFGDWSHRLGAEELRNLL